MTQFSGTPDHLCRKSCRPSNVARTCAILRLNKHLKRWGARLPRCIAGEGEAPSRELLEGNDVLTEHGHTARARGAEPLWQHAPPLITLLDGIHAFLRPPPSSQHGPKHSANPAPIRAQTSLANPCDQNTWGRMPEPRARHAHTAYAPKQVMGITYSLSSTLRAYSETPVSTACMVSGTPIMVFPAMSL